MDLPSRLDLRPEFLDDGEVPRLYAGFQRLLRLDAEGNASLAYTDVTAWLLDQRYPEERWEWVRDIFDAMLQTWTKVQRELHPPPKAR